MELSAYNQPSMGRRVALRSQLPLISSSSSRTWVHLAMTGKWEGHPTGPFEFSQDTFKTVIGNFNRQANPIPLYYEHPEKNLGNAVPAAGWVHELKVTGNQLWGLTEFTDRAAKMIRDGEYRFCSVVVLFDAVDRVSGETVGAEMLEVGLTNSPFIDGQHSIKLSRVYALGSEKLKMTNDDRFATVRALFELPEDATVESMKAALDAEDAMNKARSPEEKEPDAKQPEAVKPDAKLEQAVGVDPALDTAPEQMAASVEPAGETTALAADPAMAQQALDLLVGASGLDEAATLAFLQENLEALTSLFSGAASSEGTAAEEPAANAQAFSRTVTDAAKARVAALSKQVTDRDGEIKKLSARLQELENDKLDRRIDDAIAAGHVLDKDRDKLVKLSREAPHLLADFLGSAAASPMVPVQKSIVKAASPNKEDDGSDIDPEVMAAYMRQCSWAPKEKVIAAIRSKQKAARS